MEVENKKQLLGASTISSAYLYRTILLDPLDCLCARFKKLVEKGKLFGF